MRRAVLVTVAGGVYVTKPRPALIVQDDRFVATDSVTENGLDQDCYLMVDKVTTVRRGNAQAVIGRLDATMLVEFERRLPVFLGIGA